MRFFIFFFKTRDPEAKNCKSVPQILNPLSLNIQRSIWIVSKFEFYIWFAFYFSRLNLDGLVILLLVCCRGLFQFLKCVPFFICDDFFPSPPSSPYLPSYAKACAWILTTCHFPSPSALPQSYYKSVMGYI